MEVPRYLLFIGMMLIFGAMMAEATNYVIINRFQTANGTNGTGSNGTVEFVFQGFGLNFSTNPITTSGTISINDSQVATQSEIDSLSNTVVSYANTQVANNDTQAQEIATKGNTSSSGNNPYLPYFSSPTQLVSSPVYVASPDKIVVNGTANFTGLTTNTTFIGDVQIIGHLYGGSPVKIAGGLDVISGNSTFNDIFVSSCEGCGVFSYNGTANYSGVNATNITAINLVVLGNVSFPQGSVNWNMLYNYSNIFVGTGLYGGGSLANDVTVYLNESYLNNTIDMRMLSFNATKYNESGIARNLSYSLGVAGSNITVPLPNQKETTVTVMVTGTSQPTSLMVTFNNDMGNNYMYRRIQAYVFLYQGVTASPRTNLTLEGYQYAGQRQIELKITQAPTGAIGTFWVSTGDNITVTPYLTQGNFDWRNATATSMTIQSATGNINSGSYIIVKSEGL